MKNVILKVAIVTQTLHSHGYLWQEVRKLIDLILCKFVNIIANRFSEIKRYIISLLVAIATKLNGCHRKYEEKRFTNKPTFI